MTDDLESGTGAWEFSNGAEFPGAKGRIEVVDNGGPGTGRCLRLHYDFTGGGAYVAVYRAIPNPQAAEAIEFTVRKPAPAQLTFRATDSVGQTCQKPIRYGHDRPQRVRALMSTWAFSWGGPADRRLRQPVTRFGILLEKTGLPPEFLKGVVDIDDVAVIGGTANDGPGETLLEYVAADYPDGLALGFDANGEARIGLGAGSLLGTPSSLRFEFASVSAEAEFFVECASHFQGFRKTAGVLSAGDAPRSLTVPVPPEGWEHYGGENDGQLHGPIRLERLGARPRGGAGKAVLRRIVCTTTANPAEAVYAIPQHRDRDGLDVLEITLRNVLPTAVPGVLKADYRDENGVPVHTETVPVTVPAQGSPTVVALSDLGPQYPVLDLTVRFAATDGSTASAPISAGFGRAPEGTGDSSLKPDSPWGMGLYLYRYPGDPAGLERMRKAARLARDAGVKWSREEILWHRTEPSQGQFDWSFYDEVVRCANDHGISVYGLLTYWSSWTKPYTEEGVEDYCRWVRQVVGRYKDRIHHWEIWNEPNIFFWSGPKELYPVLLKKAYAAVKETDPEAQVLGCSTAGIDSSFIRRCLDADAPFDILTIHPYRGDLDDRGFIGELRDAVSLVNGRPAWITEMGWPTHVGGISELRQAELLSRCYLSAAAAGNSPNVSWYDFREDGADPFYNEHHFGAVRHDLTPKAAYSALAAVCTTLGTVTEAEPVACPEGFLAYRFKASDRPPTLALWSGTQGGTVLLKDVSGETLTARSFVGRDTRVPVRDGLAVVQVRPGKPVLVPDAGTATVLGLPVEIAGAGIPIRPGETEEVRITLRDASGHTVNSPVATVLPPGWQASAATMRCPKGGTGEAVIRIEAPNDAAAGPVPIAFRIDTPIGPISAETQIEVVPTILVQ